MYGVKPNTPVKAFRPGTAVWFAAAAVATVTRRLSVFEAADLLVDPTGQRRGGCATPFEQTVAGEWARAGYYGFRDAGTGWVMLVHGRYVETEPR